MAFIGTITKQPVDKIDYDIDCSDLVGRADHVLSVAASVTPATMTVQAFVIDDKTVKLWVSGGDSGTTYKVELTVTTYLDRVKQDEIRVRVKEI